MTAEVVIMNKECIVLAADSAATVVHAFGTKISNSANKISTLSKYAPVGIMLFNNANLMSMPWEVLIKEFRKRLSKNKYDSLEEYAEQFFIFLDQESDFFSEAVQDQWAGLNQWMIFTTIAKKIEEGIAAVGKGESEREAITQALLEETINETKNSVEIKFANPAEKKKITSKARTIAKSIIPSVWKNKIPPKKQQKLIENIGISLFTRELPGEAYAGHTGVVFAGYGEKEYLPSYRSYLVFGKFCNRLYARKDRKNQITFENPIGIASFAQSDVVTLFMEGIHPTGLRYLHAKTVPTMMAKLSDKIDKTGISTDKKEKMLQQVSEALGEAHNDLFQSFASLCRNTSVQPILDAAAFLPKDEIAVLAESLVNLTSLRRRVSMDPETVGGPIDVAVISKGDGFIWLKRKHYFTQEMNHQFTSTYFSEEA